MYCSASHVCSLCQRLCQRLCHRWLLLTESPPGGPCLLVAMGSLWTPLVFSRLHSHRSWTAKPHAIRRRSAVGGHSVAGPYFCSTSYNIYITYLSYIILLCDSVRYLISFVSTITVSSFKSLGFWRHAAPPLWREPQPRERKRKLPAPAILEQPTSNKKTCVRNVRYRKH